MMSDGDAEKHLEDDSDVRLLLRMSRVSNEILGELRYLREELSRRPTRNEITSRRRGMILFISVIIFLAFQVYDFHIASCSPGSQAKAGINYVARTPAGQFRNGHLRELLNNRLPDSCDLTLPLTSHNSEAWPTHSDLLGLAVYLVFFALMILWWRIPVWIEKKSMQQTPPKPPDPVSLPYER